MTEIIAQTQRLLLRTEREGDRAAWQAHMNTAQVTAHLGGPRPVEWVAEKFQRMADGWAKDGFSFMLIERKSDGLLIGHCGLSRIEVQTAPRTLDGQVQIGWTLRADCWGHGYAREAAGAVLDLAFDRFDLEGVFGQTSFSNAPSWRLMETLGMVRQAHLDYVDEAYPAADNPTIIYSMARKHWSARHQQPGQQHREMAQ